MKDSLFVSFIEKKKNLLLKNNRFLNDEYSIAGEKVFIISLLVFEVKQLTSKHLFRKVNQSEKCQMTCGGNYLSVKTTQNENGCSAVQC